MLYMILLHYLRYYCVIYSTIVFYRYTVILGYKQCSCVSISCKKISSTFKSFHYCAIFYIVYGTITLLTVSYYVIYGTISLFIILLCSIRYYYTIYGSIMLYTVLLHYLRFYYVIYGTITL